MLTMLLTFTKGHGMMSVILKPLCQSHVCKGMLFVVVVEHACSFFFLGLVSQAKSSEV